MVLSVSVEHAHVDWVLKWEWVWDPEGVRGGGGGVGGGGGSQVFTGLKSVGRRMLLHSIERKHKWQLAIHLVL